MKKTSRILCLMLTFALLMGLWIPGAIAAVPFSDITAKTLDKFIDFETEKFLELDTGIRAKLQTDTAVWENLLDVSEKEIPNDWWGKSVIINAPYDDKVTIKFPARPKVPSVKLDFAKGVFTGLTTAMEYTTDNGDNWTPAPDKPMEVDPEKTYKFRVAHTNAAPKGDETDAFVVAAKPAAPSNLAIDLTKELLTGLKAGQEYSVNGGTSWTSVSKDGDVSLTSAFTALKADSSIQVRVKGSNVSGTYTIPGAATEFKVKPRPTAPPNTIANVNTETGLLEITVAEGSSIDYRLKASGEGSEWVTITETTEDIVLSASPAIAIRITGDKEEEEGEEDVYTPASTNVSISAPKAASAPSVTLDMVNLAFKGVTDKMQYRLDDESTYTDISDSDLDGTLLSLTEDMYGTTVYFRVKWTADNLASPEKSFVVPAKGTAIPDDTISIDFKAETLKGVGKAMEYMLPGKTTYTAGADNKDIALTAVLDALTEDKDILVRYKATTGTDATAAGPATEVTLKARTAAPTIALNNATGTITVTGDDDYEVSMDKKTWSDVADNTVPVVGSKTYYVRVKATETVVASAFATQAVGKQPAAPDASVLVFDFDTDAMTFKLPAGYQYQVGEADWTTGTGNAEDLDEKLGFDGTEAVTVQIRAVGTAENLPSAAKSITIAMQAVKPTVSINYQTGKITGLKAGMQVKIGDGEWSGALSSSDVTNYTLTAADYPKDIQIRIAATATAMASNITTIDGLSAAAAPTGLAFDADKNQITGVKSTYEYSLNNTYWVACSSTLDVKHLRPETGSNIKVYIRVKGTSSAPPSQIATVELKPIVEEVDP